MACKVSSHSESNLGYHVSNFPKLEVKNFVNSFLNFVTGHLQSEPQGSCFW